MKARNFELMTAPGLPTWPKLYFDRKSKYAYVAARHPTWRSYQWASKAATMLTWTGNTMVCVVAWNCLSALENVYRLAATLAICCIAFPIASFAVRHGTVDFLARQLFATKTEFWASPNAMAFRSQIFRKPVVLWRKWKEQVVKGKFILNRDADAERFASDHGNNGKGARSHLNEAMILEVVVSALDANNTIASSENMMRRTIPITEVSSRNATKFTMVLTAAVALTSTKSSSVTRQNEGVDIDI